MEFFNRIKTKLKIKNLCWAILFLAIAVFAGWCGISNGFSSEMEWSIGLRGTDGGIPVPNWLVSGFLLLIGVIMVASAFAYIKSFAKDTEYNKMLQTVQALGDVNMIGAMLTEMHKCDYAKGGDLRFNEQLVFYLKGTNATIIPGANILGIKTEIVSRKNGEDNYVCVYHGNDVLKIKTSEKNVLLLLEEMKRVYRF